MIAVSEDSEAAQLMGINVNSIITITFAIGSALAGLAGLFYLLKAPSVFSTLGAMPGIKAFTAAVIGGIGSIPGAMLGGILLGMIECVSYKITAIAPFTDAIEFSILILILLVEQNAGKSPAISGRTYVLENGSIVLSGTGTELASSEKIRKAYLGG